MIGAALLAKKAVEKGLTRKPWVKTTLAPGSKVVSDYYDKSGLTPYLDKLGFNLVGYGCTTCIGNSGPLIPEVSAAVNEADLAVTSVLSGNRNFEGRINPDIKMNYLASPPLVVAYALAGSMTVDLFNDPLGQDTDGNDVFMKDIWPTSTEIEEVIASAINSEMFDDRYADVFAGDEQWRSLPTPEGKTFEWDADSTYVRKPPYFDGMPAEPTPVTDIEGARVLLKLGDSVTTDHISPAGAIKKDSPAGDVPRRARRGPARLQLLRLAPRQPRGHDPGHLRQHPAAQPAGRGHRGRLDPRLHADGRAGDDHLRGLRGVRRRRHPAGGPVRQGVRLRLVARLGGQGHRAARRQGRHRRESYERIHRSNLIGMGVIPLQFPAGENAESLGLDGTETFAISGITELNEGRTPKTVKVTATGRRPATTSTFDAVVRIDTPGEANYYRNGGIMQYVLRNLLRA